MSWRNNVVKEHNACKCTINTLDRLFERLFGLIPESKKETREDIIRKAFKGNSIYTNMILNF